MVSFTKRCAARIKALDEGKKTYFTGKPCKNGHTSERLVRDYSCIECRDTIYDHDRENYRKDPLARAIKGKKVVSKQKGVPFDLTNEDVERPTHCPVLGMELDYSADAKRRPDNKATLDRFKPELGYVKGNVRVISFRANFLKSNGTLEEFIKLIGWMKQCDQ